MEKKVKSYSFLDGQRVDRHGMYRMSIFLCRKNDLIINTPGVPV